MPALFWAQTEPDSVLMNIQCQLSNCSIHCDLPPPPLFALQVHGRSPCRSWLHQVWRWAVSPPPTLTWEKMHSWSSPSWTRRRRTFSTSPAEPERPSSCWTRWAATHSECARSSWGLSRGNVQNRGGWAAFMVPWKGHSFIPHWPLHSLSSCNHKSFG